MKPTKRKTFSQAEKLAFAEKHGRTCALCGRADLITGMEAKDEARKAGIIRKSVDYRPIFNGCEYMTAQKGDPEYDAIFDRVFHIDHKTPLSKGGTNDEDNLQVLCGKCNMSKGSLTLDEYLLKLKYQERLEDLKEDVADALGVDYSIVETLTKGHHIFDVYPFLERIVEVTNHSDYQEAS
ncbi:HNH endonuclease signature motif containing protein [Paenibacillus macerans]|uniref:HNH endonuclease n=1 Tax=Paenibacillus macerans TaxID=44252 RepID=UPI002DBB2890|nr:HNH endonuclease signature motif containing protein [Paenibacillus macerans]MEC0328695.1 HNH endonuclease signature motif containing protein [Paenibacillus macerans]